MYRSKSINNALVLLVVSILLAFSLSGCSSPKSKLLGKWQEIQKTEVIEFFSDNRVSITDKGMTAAGSWSILDDGRVKLEITAFGTTSAFTGKIEGDIFRLKAPDGKVSKYQKLKL